MTLSPVFRSQAAVELLARHGVWAGLTQDLEAQAAAVGQVHADLERILGPEFRKEPPPLPSGRDVASEAGLRFLQEYFFLVLFRSVFRALGVEGARLRVYTELNLCIKGTITAADNLFDDQAKSLLPLAEHKGTRFLSILQLMAFERLLRRVLDRGEEAGQLDADARDAIQRELLDRMARIGTLEGSEEAGITHVAPPDEMVEAVHRVRGGALFALAFVAPAVLERGEMLERLGAAERAVSRLGTAFQIVDDLTDFEFDVRRRRHNLLVAQVHHLGTDAERAALRRLWTGEEDGADLVSGPLRDSARAVLDRAYVEARASFTELRALGFWLDPALADDVVRAIVGLDGVPRMEALAAPD